MIGRSESLTKLVNADISIASMIAPAEGLTSATAKSLTERALTESSLQAIARAMVANITGKKLYGAALTSNLAKTIAKITALGTTVAVNLAEVINDPAAAMGIGADERAIGQTLHDIATVAQAMEHVDTDQLGALAKDIQDLSEIIGVRVRLLPGQRSRGMMGSSWAAPAA